MLERVVLHGIQYAVYGLEAGLFLYLLGGGRWKRLKGIALYVGLLVAVDALGRPYVIYRFGRSSAEYAYFFWLTDIALLLAAFLLVGSLFRRACHHQPELWGHVRLMLSFVLLLVVAISLLSLHRNFENLFSVFIVEFQQNLYFTCLVLLTLLYVLMQKVERTEDELTLLVSGLGIQFAGPAASLALVYLTPGQEYGRAVWTYGAPLCTMGMLLIWFQAASYSPKAAGVPGFNHHSTDLAEAMAREG